MNPAYARRTVVVTGQQLSNLGLSPGSTGSISVRMGDHIVCSPTGSRLGQLREDTLSITTLDGAHVDGLPPTKEIALHCGVYAGSSTVGAVVHTHSRHAVAVSCLAGGNPDNAVTPLTPYLTLKGGQVTRIEYMRPGHQGLGAAVEAKVRRGARTFLLDNHGTLVAALDAESAVDVAAELEESAAIQLLTLSLPVRPLTAAQVDELRT